MNLKLLEDTGTLTNEDIAARVVNGDINLYEVLMRRLNARLFRISMSMVNDEMSAEDVMQNAYINAYLQLARFNGQAKFSTWITRILINECILHQKKTARRQELISKKENNELDQQTPLNKLMDKELKSLLESAIAGLPEKYRTVFVMRQIEEMSTHETMEVLDIDESNVKIRLMRAKALLRDQLSSQLRMGELFEFNLVRCDKVVGYVMNKISR
jgi:RNA polymerase sigma factor (sigma-70 family)